VRVPRIRLLLEDIIEDVVRGHVQNVSSGGNAGGLSGLRVVAAMSGEVYEVYEEHYVYTITDAAHREGLGIADCIFMCDW
jgi:hypothetical protein